MFAVVESGSITSMPKGNKGITIDGVQHSADIFTAKWTEAQRNAIGVYTVEIDETNKKDEEWYVNTNITYAFGSGKVTGTYGTATAKPIADVLYTEQNKTDNEIPEGKDVGDVAVKGLKTVLIETIKAQAAGELEKTDWYIVRKADAGTAVPSSITTHRAAVRTKAAEMETSITNAADTEALKTLFTYVNTADEGEPEVMARPIGNLPTLES